jgi:hypothetical protein
MLRFELSLNNTIKLLTLEPLLIVRLPILQPGITTNIMRPVRKKTYKYHTFDLCIPLELDDNALVGLKMECLPWLSLLGELLRITPPYSITGGTLFKHVWTYPRSQYRCQASSIWFPLDAHLELALQLDQFSNQFIFLHNDGALKMHMRAHSILF